MRFVVDARYARLQPSGIGSYVKALAERLPSLAPDLHFRYWAHPSIPEPASGPNVVCVVVPALADGLRTLFAPSTLDRLEQDDVLHMPASMLGRGLSCTSVVTVMDLMWLEQPELVDKRPAIRRVRQRFYQAGMRRALAQATRIMTISEATAARVRAQAPGSAGRVRVTHLAASAIFAPPSSLDAARAEAARILGTDAPFYLVVGKNEPYKAHQIAVEAFARSAGPREVLVLVQRTSKRRGLGGLAVRLGIADRLRWLPGLPLDQMIVLLQAARALLQPSLVEGFGLPALEAMSCGCPVVASDTPALVEVVGGAGLHAAVGDVSAFAAALRRLNDGSLGDELRARGLERAKAFDWNTTARQTLEVLREAAAEGPRDARVS